MLLVPHVQGAITLDGDLDDPGWLGPVAHSGAFSDKTGDIAKPYSAARFAWGDGELYVSLYAADQDIRAVAENPADVWKDDSFHVVFDDGANERIFDVSAKAKLATSTRPSRFAMKGDRPAASAWESGAHASVELDGTPNKSDDNDEEWNIEMAIPLSSLGLKGNPGERLSFAAHRCDSPKNAPRSCGSYGERTPITLVLQ
ncbi:MAG: sugar-binding protein [Polyangiaceae bacterium]